MIPLPTGDPFQYENAFYLSAQPHRLGKMIAQYELFKRTLEVPGAIVEAGVFKSASFCRWAMFRALFCDPSAKKLIGFDTFQMYEPPYVHFDRDHELAGAVIANAGNDCISTDQLLGVLKEKGCERNVELWAGYVEDTVPAYLESHPELVISLLNVDLDFYSGTKVVIEKLWPRVAVGGIMVLDDYVSFQGANQAIGELLPGAEIKHFPYAYSPSFLEKKA